MWKHDRQPNRRLGAVILPASVGTRKNDTPVKWQSVNVSHGLPYNKKSPGEGASLRNAFGFLLSF